MENLQLIMVTVLITLISGALVGSLIYLGVVVRKLRRTVDKNVLDIKNLENALNEEAQNIYNKIDDCCLELDRKIDSRYDKLLDNISRDIEILKQTIKK